MGASRVRVRNVLLSGASVAFLSVLLVVTLSDVFTATFFCSGCKYHRTNAEQLHSYQAPTDPSLSSSSGEGTFDVENSPPYAHNAQQVNATLLAQTAEDATPSTATQSSLSLSSSEEQVTDALPVLPIVESVAASTHLKNNDAEGVENERDSNPQIAADYSVLSERIPACAAKLKPAKTFLILMSSHTGSTAITSILNQHPDLSVKVDNTFEPLNRPMYVENSTLAAEYTRQIFEEGVRKGVVTGFKLSAFPVMRAKEEFAQLIRDFDTRVIWNYRTDIFKRAVGRYPAYFLGDETAIGGVNAVDTDRRCEMGLGCKVKVEKVEDLHCTMTRGYRVHIGMEEAVDIMTKYADPPSCALNAPYHDFLRNPEEVTMQIMDFLGVKRMQFESKRGKATSDNICEVVDNYGDLCAAFEECSNWHDMLNDVENNCTCSQYNYVSRGGDGVNPLCEKRVGPKAVPWCGNW